MKSYNNVFYTAGYAFVFICTVICSVSTVSAQQLQNDTLFMLPGSGFATSTPQPRAVGTSSDPGYEASAIARWTTVPFQTIDAGEMIRVGVAAFHRNGIEKVSFSANGGRWIDSTQAEVDPDSGVAQYWAMLRASDFDDGNVEIRAIVYPKTAGIPLVLGGPYQLTYHHAPFFDGVYSLVLWTNNDGTLSRTPRYVSERGSDVTGNGTQENPFQTLSKAAQSIQTQYGSLDGATIYAFPGTYDFQMKWAFTFASADDRFVTITSAPGISSDDVIIDEARPKAARIHLKNVTLQTNEDGNFYTGYTHPQEQRTVLWFDGVKVSAPTVRYAQNSNLVSVASYYVTNSSFANLPNGPLNAILLSNSEISNVISDAISGVQTVLNVTVTNIDPLDTGAHADVYEIVKNGTEDGTGNTQMNNYIVSGLYADAFKGRGITLAFLGAGEVVRNSAFVNIVLDPSSPDFTSSFTRPMDNVLFAHNTFKQTLHLRALPSPLTSFVGNIFNGTLINPTEVNVSEVGDAYWNHNHFVLVPPTVGMYTFGDDVTTGVPAVESWVNGAFTPQKDGALVARVQALFSPLDVFGDDRYDVSAVGAIEGEVTPCASTTSCDPGNETQ